MTEPVVAPEPESRALAALNAIAVRALSSNLQRIEELDEAVRRGAAGELDDQEWRQAAETAHRLVGSAGTFGHRQASELARGVELVLRQPDRSEEAVRAVAADLALIRSDLLQHGESATDWG